MRRPLGVGGDLTGLLTRAGGRCSEPGPLDFPSLPEAGGAAQNRSPTHRDREERRGGAGCGEGPGGLRSCLPTPGGGGEEAAFPACHRGGPAWPWEPGEGGVLDPQPGRGCPAQGHRLARHLLRWASRREIRGPSRSPLWDEVGGPGQPGWGQRVGPPRFPLKQTPPSFRGPHMTPGLWQEVAGPGVWGPSAHLVALNQQAHSVLLLPEPPPPRGTR